MKRFATLDGVTAEHFKGLAAEHRIAAHYLAQHMPIYWPACPMGRVDFIVEKGGRLLRVQVKTAIWSRGHTKHRYLQARTRIDRADGATVAVSEYCDLFVVVYADDVWEIPASEITSSNISLASTNPLTRRGQNGAGSYERWQRFKILPQPPAPPG